MLFIRLMMLVSLGGMAPRVAPAAEGDKVWKFGFGTPTSVLRAGFTRVTVHDGFTPDRINVALLAGDRLLAGQTPQAKSGAWQGAFETNELAPGVYTLRATIVAAQEGAKSAEERVIVAPDPFAW